MFQVVNAAASNIQVTRPDSKHGSRATISFNTKFERNLEFFDIPYQRLISANKKIITCSAVDF
jgi:hypothetical protein